MFEAIRPVSDRPNVTSGAAIRAGDGPDIGAAAARVRRGQEGGRTRERGDGAELSDEAAEPDVDERKALAEDPKDKKDPREEQLQELQKKIQEAQEELQTALQSGDDAAIEAAVGKLTDLMGELQGVLGNQNRNGGNQNQPPGGGAPPAPPAAGGAPPAGGGAPPAGGGAPPAGGGAPPATGGAPPASGGAPPATGNVAETRVPPPELSANDQKLASFIEKQLENTPAGGKGLGAHFVAAGRQSKVDPLALVAIAKHETGFGSLGVGIDKMLGVGAYDSNPDGRTPFDGALNQIYSGARTFANLRAKGGANEGDALGVQLAAVNRGGWATDQAWHTKVAAHYNNIVANA